MDVVKNVLSQSDCKILKSAICQEKTEESLHADTDWRKEKGDVKISCSERESKLLSANLIADFSKQLYLTKDEVNQLAILYFDRDSVKVNNDFKNVVKIVWFTGVQSCSVLLVSFIIILVILQNENLCINVNYIDAWRGWNKFFLGGRLIHTTSYWISN